MENVCFTPAEDALLAQGWPRVVAFVDGHPHDKRPVPNALKVFNASDPIYFTEWPRNVAYRFLRAGDATQFERNATKTAEITAAASAAVENDTPFTKAEAIAAFRRAFRRSDEFYQFKSGDYVLALEQLAGTEAILDALAAELPAFTPTQSKGGTPFNSYFKARVAHLVGFMLLRVSDDVATRIRNELEPERKRLDALVSAQSLHDWSPFTEGLDMSLHGAAAVRRAMTGRISLDSLEHAHDDPAWVRECVRAEPKQPMSVRLAKIAGPEALEQLSARKFAARELPSMVRDFGMVKSEHVVRWILSLVGKSALKDAPLAWFRAHAAYARPILESASKKTGGLATQASSVLRALD